jgi:hypothetical protein
MTKTYSGGCHCGAVRFEADLDLTKPVSHCNCTLCVRRVSSTAIVKPEALRTSGEAPAEYTRRPGGIRFFFCRTCGIHTFGRGDIPELGGAYAAVNVNCLDDIDPSTLKVVHFDGRHNNWQAGAREQPWPVSP